MVGARNWSSTASSTFYRFVSIIITLLHVPTYRHCQHLGERFWVCQEADAPTQGKLQLVGHWCRLWCTWFSFPNLWKLLPSVLHSIHGAFHRVWWFLDLECSRSPRRRLMWVATSLLLFSDQSLCCLRSLCKLIHFDTPSSTLQVHVQYNVHINLYYLKFAPIP